MDAINQFDKHRLGYRLSRTANAGYREKAANDDHYKRRSIEIMPAKVAIVDFKLGNLETGLFATFLRLFAQQKTTSVFRRHAHTFDNSTVLAQCIRL